MAFPKPDLLLCPQCRGSLQQLGEVAFQCANCAKQYPYENGVLRISKPAWAEDSETTKTVEQFGESWHTHSHQAEYFEQQFKDWIAPVPSELFRDATVLEGGCGKGRHSKTVSGWAPKDLYSVDLSSAVDLAAKVTGGNAKVHCIQADLLNLPFRENAFDIVFCVGVLHHLADPFAGLKELWRTLRPGGTLALWVYGKEGNGWILWTVDPLRKHITSKIPTRILKYMIWPLAGFLYCVLKLFYLPSRKWNWLAKLLPYQSYLSYIAGFPYREIEHLVLDHLCPPIAFYLPKSTLESWFAQLQPAQVSYRWHNRNSWAVTAKK